MELRPIESSKLPTSNYVKFHCFKSTVDKKGEKNVTEREREREREREEQSHSVGFGTRFDYLFPILSKRSDGLILFNGRAVAICSL